MVKRLRAGNRVMASIKRFLERKLRLQVNEKKRKVAPVEECGFLGFVFSLYAAKSGGVRNPFWNLSGGYVSLPEGVGLSPWSTDIRRWQNI